MIVNRTVRSLGFGRAFGFLLLAFSFLSASASAEHSRTVVVGDVHGDYEAYISVLTEAGVVDKRGRWSGGDTRLIQMGDIPDRGPATRQVMEHLMRIERQAKRDGGEVIVFIGNHEAMMILGDLRYVTPEEYAEFRTSRSKSVRDQFFNANKVTYSVARRQEDSALSDKQIRDRFDEEFPLGYVEHRQAWAPTGRFGKWVLGNDAVALIDGILYVHAGIEKSKAADTIDGINAEVHRALEERESIEITAGRTSPMWYRGNVKETPEAEAEVDAVLEAFGAQRIIVGHTPSRKGIKTVHGGKLIIVDTGMSAHYGGTRSYLEIKDGTFTAVDDGVARVLFGEAP